MSLDNSKQELIDIIKQKDQEIKNLHKSLNAQAEIANYKTSELRKLKEKPIIDKAKKLQSKLKKDELELIKSEAQHKKKDKFT